MWQGMQRSARLGGMVVVAIAALAPCARASITPTMSLDQSAGTAAGSVTNLGVDLKFTRTGSDSPDDLTLKLPSGLLADASINGGACLTAADLSDTACQVGTGTVTADADGTIPITTPVTFDLVPPPAAGDLAGLAVNSNGTEIGSTADVKVRPSGDPDGVGITIDLVLPNTLFDVPISIADINSTFDGLRYPATCPSTPQSFSVSVNSYDDATIHTVTAPLSVTGCSSLPYSPAFSVTAVRDSADTQVKLVTQVTQTAAQAPSRSVTLTFPPAALTPNFGSITLLCASISSGTCTPVGSVTATSPLYPKPLTGLAYLTGSETGLSLTLVFPSPFPLTLTGSVDLVTNSTSFTGLPDIPLTDLEVSLNPGTYGLFGASCRPPSGTATAGLTDQNGDQTVSAPANFAVSGCPSTSLRGNGSQGIAGPQVTKLSASGLGTGHASLSFRVAVAKRAAKLDALTIELPAGLSFAHHGSGDRLTVTGVTISGATVRSLTLAHGHLLITLRKPVASLTIRITAAGLRESSALKAKAKAKQLHSLSLTVITTNTDSKRTTIHVLLKNLGL